MALTVFLQSCRSQVPHTMVWNWNHIHTLGQLAPSISKFWFQCKEIQIKIRILPDFPFHSIAVRTLWSRMSREHYLLWFTYIAKSFVYTFWPLRRTQWPTIDKVSFSFLILWFGQKIEWFLSRDGCPLCLSLSLRTIIWLQCKSDLSHNQKLRLE